MQKETLEVAQNPPEIFKTTKQPASTSKSNNIQLTEYFMAQAPALGYTTLNQTSQSDLPAHNGPPNISRTINEDEGSANKHIQISD